MSSAACFFLLIFLRLYLISPEYLDSECVNNSPGYSQSGLSQTPWIALIISAKKTCTGTLINKHYVLTVANCAIGPIERVSVWDFHTKVQAIITHKLYNQDKFVNDMALLRLKEEVQYTANIKPICIYLKKLSSYDGLYNIQTIRLGSNGAPTVTNILEFSQKNCSISSGRLPDNSQICAGVKNGEHCVNQGSPLIVSLLSKKKTSFALIGVQSDGVLGICVYTKVSSFIDWIVGVVLEVDVIV